MSGADDAQLWQVDEDRWAERRAQYLAGQYDIDGSVAEALAYSELGFSSSGVAKRVDKTEGTVRTYLEKVENEFSAEAAMARASSQLDVDADLPGGDGR